MFERARLLLTASYAAALGLTLLGVGIVTYLLIDDDLRSEIDRSLEMATADLDTDTFPAPAAEPGLQQHLRCCE